MRFQGGNNAGHTLVLGGEIFKLHLIPSGVLRRKKLFIGAGVIVNPQVLLEELANLEQRGIKPELLISEKAHVIFPFHITQDELSEGAQGELAAGSTKRGIAPTYSDKSARFGIRMIDLTEPDMLSEKLSKLIKLKNKTFKYVYDHDEEIDFEETLKQYLDYGKRLRDNIGNVSFIVNKALDEGKMIVFEGAQGALLCIDHGVYPHTTSSNPIAGAACVGTGVGPTRIKRVVGVSKAYTTRVGKSPFVSEINDEIAEFIREKGNEYGTTTGRPRRVGWLDLVTLRYAKMVNGLTELALTKIDVLGSLEKVKICTHYKHNDNIVKNHPASLSVFRKCKPVYREFDGFEIHEKAGIYEDLPESARTYVEFIENHLKIPIKIISIGPDRSQTLFRR